MKRRLAFVFLFFVVGAIGYLGVSIFQKLQAKQALKERIAKLPLFSLRNIKGKTIHSDEDKAKSLIITYFNTGCHFCQGEIRSMSQHPVLQQESTIYLISDQSKQTLKEFAAHFKLDSVKGIQILRDRDRKIKKLFGINGVPSTFIYDSKDSLIKSFQGETKAEVLYQTAKK